MKGYIFDTEEEAKEARIKSAKHKGYPKKNGRTTYWVNYSYSKKDGFYYIRYTEGIEEVLGVPKYIELTNEDVIV